MHLLLSIVLAVSQITLFSEAKTCKVLPTDSAWPSPAAWSAFNHTVGGNLIKSVPIGAPCFNGPLFDANECQVIQNNWTNPELYLPDPSAIMDSIFVNNSCNPFLGPSGQCVVGSYPQYVVNISSPSDVMKTVAFAKKNNVRLIVKNTGHDYMGRSVGGGALSIWTHYHQEQEWFDNYQDPWSSYMGPAFRAHSGAMGIQIYEEADKRGYFVVGGECHTVGFVGGYVQGGGHSVMSTFKGMAADQVLSFEVITTDERFVNASATENSDLYFALRGGGGGAYGIVWTITVKAYKDVPVSVGTFAFTVADNGVDKFWKAAELYQRSTPNFTDHDAYSAVIMTSQIFSVQALALPNQTLADLTTVTKPLFDGFDALGLIYTRQLNEYPGYFTAFENIQGFINFPVNNAQTGSRLIPRSIWDSEDKFQAFFKILRAVTDANLTTIDIAINPKLQPTNNGNSAVYPQWRTAQRHFITQAPYGPLDTQTKLQNDVQTLTSFDSQLSSLVPGGMGAYLNEANPFDPNWKQDFYGPNYNKLLQIKDKYDPDQLLWGKISVGGDRWAIQSDGRLCKT